jgi:DNA-binding CsgD family transcriptional regulator/tetratricopeptide (TPR) repeat protein
MRASVVGRAAELAAIGTVLDPGDSGAAAFVLDGEAGIGKTTVWLAAVEAGRDQGRRVLSCRPAETEASLPFVSLGDLLAPALDDASALPPAQRAALETALGRAEPTEGFGQVVVARATLALLQALAAESPLLVAIDDVQWLDASTQAVLEFAVRRVSDLPVHLLLARRSETDAPAPLGLARALPAGQLAQARLGPLPPHELDLILRSTLELALSRPRLLELYRVSGGNPFHALEIARRGIPADSLEPLVVAESVGELVRDRLAALSGPARRAALLTVAAVRPTSWQIERIAGVDSLAEALRLGIVELDGERLRATHPLLASVLYDGAAPGERRDAHARLADVVDDQEENARHLALSTESADEPIAAALEHAAGFAVRRGAPQSAAVLAEHAVRLTPADLPGEGRRRRLAAASHHYAAGDQERSRSILQALCDELPAGADRARALAQLSQSVPSQGECLELCLRGLSEAGDDALLRSELHFLAAASARRATTLLEAAEHARLAGVFATEAQDDTRRARALAMLGHVEAMLGAEGGLRELERAAEIESSLTTLPLHFRPTFLLGITLLYLCDLDSARPLLQAQHERANREGDEVMRGVALATLSELELRAGNWAEAYRCAHDGASLQEQAAPLQDQAHHVLKAARVAAHMGRIDEARAVAVRLLELAPQHRDRMAEVSARRDLGFMELSLGDAAAAVQVLEPAVQLLEEMGLRLYAAQPLLHDFVEALVAIGDLDRAAAANALLARSTGPWEKAVAHRGRALIAAASGDEAEADVAIAAALESHEHLPVPFELGRTLLIQGSIERRAKRRGSARRALIQALELFDTLGAPLWAERAAAELARIPGRAPGDGELSETQRRIAELVAEGCSNKEIAARLFVTVRTVEANLSKMYAKLGVHSRTELTSRLVARP